MAEMVRCEKCGSFFDQEKSNACPYCKNTTVSTGNATEPVGTEPITGTNGATAGNKGEFYTPVYPDKRSAMDDDITRLPGMVNVDCVDHITGVNGNFADPVVGWLVCLSGSEKGRDYRIHAHNNFIGRDRKMDICISGDESISRERHAIITYDNRDRVFYFAAGEGRSIIRLNGKAVLSTIEIKAYDKIEIGNTELLFVPLCGEGFDWADTKTEE